MECSTIATVRFDIFRSGHIGISFENSARSRFGQISRLLFVAQEQNTVNYHVQVCARVDFQLLPYCVQRVVYWMPAFNTPAYRVPLPITTKKYDAMQTTASQMYIYKYYHTKLPYISFSAVVFFRYWCWAGLVAVLPTTFHSPFQSLCHLKGAL